MSDEAATTAKSDEDLAASERLYQAKTAVYAGLTLMGVVAAASWKSAALDGVELEKVIIGTSFTVALAHIWASVVAHRLVRKRPFTRPEKLHELSFFTAFAGTGAVTAGVAFVGIALDFDIDSIVTLTLGFLTIALFTVGFIGSRRAGASWIRALLWGLLDAGVGVVVLLAKTFLGG